MYGNVVDWVYQFPRYFRTFLAPFVYLTSGFGSFPGGGRFRAPISAVKNVKGLKIAGFPMLLTGVSFSPVGVSTHIKHTSLLNRLKNNDTRQFSTLLTLRLIPCLHKLKAASVFLTLLIVVFFYSQYLLLSIIFLAFNCATCLKQLDARLQSRLLLTNSPSIRE